MKEENDGFVLYVDEKSSIKAFFVDSKTRSKVCFVIFSPLGERNLCTKGRGADPLLREGYDVISVQSNCDDWHQNVSIKGIYILQGFLNKTYDVAKGYGSSMGGFAAICYAERLNLKSVLALSPQYTISESFDKRWSRENKLIVWHQTAEMAITYDGVIRIVYDPFDLDALQAKLICDNFTKATIHCHEIKFGSHFIPKYLNEGGVLKNLLLSFANGDFQIPNVEKRNNKIYLAHLSSRLFQKSKLKWANAVIQRSIELGDERHSSYRQASNISHHLKEIGDAIVFAKQAIEAKDNNDRSRANHKEHLAKMLHINGQLDDALSVVDELLQTDEMRFSAYSTKAEILLDMQRVDEANFTIQRSIELGNERHSAYRQASNISHRLKEVDDAIAFAKQAINAKDNTDRSRANHKEHLAKMLRIDGRLDDALSVVDEKK